MEALLCPCFEFYRVTIKREKYKRNNNISLTQVKIEVKFKQSEWARHPNHTPERLLSFKNCTCPLKVPFGEDEDKEPCN